MDETHTYYVTVAVDRHVLPERVKIVAVSKSAAAEMAETAVAMTVRDTIAVKAINVRKAYRAAFKMEPLCRPIENWKQFILRLFRDSIG